eukprot:TRINITY_DN51555_c0_g1_i3.p1 TRINITY_DN51555_c0_g1~~TRINITY_DN51555_c0_g1_i3.p1  ORF type:complete len:255 (-),score=39.90 TRINITY_DN51555_c0_g1_i3:414-1178(-)
MHDFLAPSLSYKELGIQEDDEEDDPLCGEAVLADVRWKNTHVKDSNEKLRRLLEEARSFEARASQHKARFLWQGLDAADERKQLLVQQRSLQQRYEDLGKRPQSAAASVGGANERGWSVPQASAQCKSTGRPMSAPNYPVLYTVQYTSRRPPSSTRGSSSEALECRLEAAVEVPRSLLDVADVKMQPSTSHSSQTASESSQKVSHSRTHDFARPPSRPCSAPLQRRATGTWGSASRPPPPPQSTPYKAPWRCRR